VADWRVPEWQWRVPGAGCNPGRIAGEVGIIPKTVDVHKLKIRQRLQLTEGTSLSSFAIRRVELRRLDSRGGDSDP
jgi:DNA-binding NarL/FixJ family response regulator